ncbi:MAG: ABC transporter ATP-binding protein [Candidatus Saccharimonas sp.]
MDIKVPQLFEAHDISLDFSIESDEIVQVIKPCSFSVPKGLITIIYGASGSGKSSLLNILSGLQAPTHGELNYNGKNVYEKTTDELAYFRAVELGIVYQTNYWVKSLSVRENVCLPQYFLGKSRHQAHQTAEAVLDRIGMKKHSKKRPTLLSGGEQQRIAMARAIINDSAVIIADEPTGNLDSISGDMIINLLSELQNNDGKTIILVTHNMEYLPFAHHLINVQDGNITEISKKDIPKTIHDMLQSAQDRIASLISRGASR